MNNFKETAPTRRPGRPRKETVSTKETASGKETASVKETVPALAKETAHRKKEILPTKIYRNNALQNIGMEIAEGEEMNANTKIITKNLEIMNLPEIDLRDPQAVRARIQEYFGIEAKWGFKPTVAGLGNALNGLSRQRLWEIRMGADRRGNQPYDLPSESSDEIKRAYKYMEQNWEDYMSNGKINPVAGIFLGKNNYGYQDKTEYVLTPNQQASDFSEKQLLDRYGMGDSGSDSEQIPGDSD